MNRFPRKLNARCPSIRTACRGLQRRYGRSSWIWPNNWIVPWPSRTSSRVCCANYWKRSVKVLDHKLPFARIGRIWPYVGDAHHPVIVYDYTPTRSRASPAKFLEGYKGYLQADAYSVYDAFFKPQWGMTEVGCRMHARRYLFQALESDEPHMGPALHLIARLYAVEERAKALSLSENQRLALRQRVSTRLLGQLHQYLLELQSQVLPKSPSGAAVRYALNRGRR